MEQTEPREAAAWRLVAVVCAAQVLVQIGAFFWPALLPGSQACSAAGGICRSAAPLPSATGAR